jgi:NAD(P) transhydrogenase subunit alpha
MKIAVLRETVAGELRVAATPETVTKFIGLGAEVSVETGAGLDELAVGDAGAKSGASFDTDLSA